MALLHILGCTMEEPIESIEAAGAAKKTQAVGGDAGIGDLAGAEYSSVQVVGVMCSLVLSPRARTA
ncbi:hypothetical protein AB0L65_56030 [Nonomuraea sp. NPDC052116]|uniref:hypothetical protein n=1 Tax=Nonomuraea sp. NPDC052116 TaxID=3155665 RepID=UPI003441EF29